MSMCGFMSSFNRKRHQRALNASVRKMNKNLSEDELWRGRFFIRQISSSYHTYEDKSGGYLNVVLRFYDKKTKQYRDFYETANHFTLWHGFYLFRAMNNFIIDDIDVWKKENPYEDNCDYTKYEFDYANSIDIG